MLSVSVIRSDKESSKTSLQKLTKVRKPMPRTQIPPLKARRIQESLREEKIQNALTSRSKLLENGKREKNQTKKTVGELWGWLNTLSIEGQALRPINTYVPKSHNLEKQLRGLLNHLFVRYAVPLFLYDACLKDDTRPFNQKQEIYRKWFVTLAQGGSFPKLVKDFMTSKEAFLFLSAPADKRIHENVWWAKMKAAGLPTNVIEKLIERIFTHHFFDDPDARMAEVLQFYARFHLEMDKVTFGEVTDFIAWRLREDQEFRLKGRTVSSVIKLTNEWHLLMQKAKLGHNIEWKGLGLTDWEFEDKDKIWKVFELRNNRDLMNEGRKQRHCVYSYVNGCVAGRSAIFSLRSYRKLAIGCTDEGQIHWDNTQEQTRVTIEVNGQRTVVQVRGVLNRLPNVEEKRVMRHWTGEKGLTMSS